jgi:eukaryotic-like serine/threonine-protein kinase
MLTGKVLRNRYRILKFLGGGAFGETYLAEDLDLPNHPKFVVKQLKPKILQAEVLQVARRLFENEARYLYQLGNLSQQIPKLLAHFEENGEFYLVQEFIDGNDLSAEIIPGKKWSEQAVIQLLQEILEVLAIVHQQNIIHRDIKPKNLMRRKEDGKIVLIDFGAVKEVKGLGVDTQGQVTSTIVIGSNGYMPNEQANSKPKLASDIYAVGVIGIQALTGKLPQEFAEDPKTGEIIWQHEVNVSKKLASFLNKMVSYHFSQRYQSANEALQALKSASSGSLSFIPFKIRKLVSTNKILISSCFGIIVFIGLGTILINYLNRPNPISSSNNTLNNINVSEPMLDVKLVCPEIDLPSLENKKYWVVGRTRYYDLPKNQFNGRGILTLPNNQAQGAWDRYDGEIKNNKFNGCGTYTFANGNRYIGQFENGFYQGKGKLICKNGQEFIGTFKKGVFEGEGIFVSKNGLRKNGLWKGGKLIEDENITVSCDAIY